jgi:D-alanyl-D-alanine carboxypeptidase (penicillin-binding protein 5/6)
VGTTDMTLPKFCGLAAVAWILFGHPAAAVETTAKEALIIDADTDAVLFEKNAYEPMHPASMSKMMTVNMIFERLKAGRLSMDDTFTVSENAWRKGGAKTGGSTMFLEIGQRVKVADLIRGIIIQSGNDACIVMAEGLAGSEEAFADEMNKRAKEIGLTNAHFVNSTGLPDPDHLMSPRDLAILARHTINNFPEYYPIYSEKEFTFNRTRQGNRNPMLYHDKDKTVAVDGLKTGHTEESGYGLTASAVRDGRRLIVVLNGMKTLKERDQESVKMFDWAFAEYKNYELFKGGEVIANADVWLGDGATVPLKIDKRVLLTLPRKSRKDLKVTVSYVNPMPAPIAEGAQVGEIQISAPDMATLKVPLLAGTSVQELGPMGRISEAIKYVLWGKSSG